MVARTKGENAFFWCSVGVRENQNRGKGYETEASNYLEGGKISKVPSFSLSIFFCLGAATETRFVGGG